MSKTLSQRRARRDAPRPLAEAVAVVTGAGSGLGAALSRRLAGEGASVAVVDLRADRAERVAAELRGSGGDVGAFTCDVGDRDQVRRLFEQIAGQWGRVDLLVNNAGRSTFLSFLDMTDDEIDWTTGPNLMGPVHCIRAAAPLMAPGSRIVNVSSLSGRIPTPGEAYYSALKAAVVSLSESLDAELRGCGIRVMVVLPSEMDTALFAEHPSWDARPEWQRRMLIPADRVAAAVIAALRRSRFQVVYPPRMLAPLAIRRLSRTLFREGVARYYRTVEGRIARPRAGSDA